MRHIWWVLGLKKNSPLIAVRIEVLCFYTFSTILNFLCFQDITWNYTQKAVNFQFFLVPGSDFRPCWCQDMQGIYTKKYIVSKLHKFFEEM